MASQTASKQPGLAVSAIGAACLGLAIDAVIFSVSAPGAASPPGFPPSWFIGSVWVILFGLMGAAWWLVRRRATAAVASWGLVFLLLSCAAYPFYTAFFSSTRAELTGNLVTIVFALAVAAGCWRSSRPASLLVLPTAAWVAFATFLTWKGR